MNMYKGHGQNFLHDEDDQVFLITYADLVTLILVFFILLYALSVREIQICKIKVDQMETQVNGNQEKKNSPPFIIEEITGLRPRNVKLTNALSRLAAQQKLYENISLHTHQGKIILDIAGEALFASGSARMNPQALPLFENLASIFKEFPEYAVNIKGHTDDIPIATAQYPSNWELSAIRATTVLKFLIQLGIEPHVLTATGYGDSMPTVPNISDANRARNRRVEFVLEKKDTPF